MKLVDNITIKLVTNLNVLLGIALPVTIAIGSFVLQNAKAKVELNEKNASLLESHVMEAESKLLNLISFYKLRQALGDSTQVTPQDLLNNNEETLRLQELLYNSQEQKNASEREYNNVLVTLDSLQTTLEGLDDLLYSQEQKFTQQKDSMLTIIEQLDTLSNAKGILLGQKDRFIQSLGKELDFRENKIKELEKVIDELQMLTVTKRSNTELSDHLKGINDDLNRITELLTDIDNRIEVTGNQRTLATEARQIIGAIIRKNSMFTQ